MSSDDDDCCCYFGYLFDDVLGESRSVGLVVPLPSDVWGAIAAHLSCVDARRTAFVCRAAARGVGRLVPARRATVARFDAECAELASRLDTCWGHSFTALHVDAVTASAMAYTWLVDHVGMCVADYTARLWLLCGGIVLYLTMRTYTKRPNRCIVWRLRSESVHGVHDSRTRDVWTMRRHLMSMVHRHLGSSTGAVMLPYVPGNLYYPFLSTVAPCMRAALLNGRRDAESMWSVTRKAYVDDAKRRSVTTNPGRLVAASIEARFIS